VFESCTCRSFGRVCLRRYPSIKKKHDSNVVDALCRSVCEHSPSNNGQCSRMQHSLTNSVLLARSTQRAISSFSHCPFDVDLCSFRYVSFRFKYGRLCHDDDKLSLQRSNLESQQCQQTSLLTHGPVWRRRQVGDQSRRDAVPRAASPPLADRVRCVRLFVLLLLLLLLFRICLRVA
jgi:hypothetical protein